MAVGSSPLARGTRSFHAGVLLSTGLIPARAGNTPSMSHLPSRTGAHPRSRGEHAEVLRYGRDLGGSSPLARGTRENLSSGRNTPGLIPARAGNTGNGTRLLWLAWAHPRSRGEHYGSLKERNRMLGSSPLARGTLHRPTRAGWLDGLIPARAGNTWIRLHDIVVIRAHPRSRGEHTRS